MKYPCFKKNYKKTLSCIVNTLAIACSSYIWSHNIYYQKYMFYDFWF